MAVVAVVAHTPGILGILDIPGNRHYSCCNSCIRHGILGYFGTGCRKRHHMVAGSSGTAGIHPVEQTTGCLGCTPGHCNFGTGFGIGFGNFGTGFGNSGTDYLVENLDLQGYSDRDPRPICPGCIDR